MLSEILTLFRPSARRTMPLALNIAGLALGFAACGWLAGFDQRITLSPGYFVLSACVAVLLSTCTVASQTLRAARAAPGWALRQE